MFCRFKISQSLSCEPPPPPPTPTNGVHKQTRNRLECRSGHPFLGPCCGPLNRVLAILDARPGQNFGTENRLFRLLGSKSKNSKSFMLLSKNKEDKIFSDACVPCLFQLFF